MSIYKHNIGDWLIIWFSVPVRFLRDNIDGPTITNVIVICNELGDGFNKEMPHKQQYIV